MKTKEKTDGITKTLLVPATAKDAFDTFVCEFSSWWPAEYSWSGDDLEDIGIEPRENGMCYEIGPHNFRCDWGRVLAFEPPFKIVFTWQISPSRVPEPNPEKASEIEVTFSEIENSMTEVSFEHRNFSKHGYAAEQYKKVMNSEQGWDYILDRYEEKFHAKG